MKFRKSLTRLFSEAPVVPLSNHDKIVVFSDLHLGNGGTRDDFLPNAALFQAVLRHYYLQRRFTLVLNGDIEELQRFPFRQILNRWQDIYRLFHQFEQRQAFYKILGNHDWELLRYENPFLSSPLHAALIFNRNGQQIVVFHGHQASLLIGKCHKLCKWVLRYLANPAGIKNFAVSPESKYPFKTEQKIYHFARERQVVTLIGHTHRPLFESVGATDRLNSRIEELCRAYCTAASWQQPELAQKITACREQLRQLTRSGEYAYQNSLYNRETLIPCVFNSGSAIARNGISALEIAGGEIALVEWSNLPSGGPLHSGPDAQRLQLGGNGFIRRVVKQDDLDYIFARIKLLA